MTLSTPFLGSFIIHCSTCHLSI